MVDLDSDPTKLIEIVEIGKQLLITRGRADHVLHRQRHRQVLRDHPGDVRRGLPGPGRAQHHAAGSARTSAILSAVIFNALIIIALIPLALRGRAVPAGQRATAADAATCWIYGLGGIDRAVRRHQAHRPARPVHPGDLDDAPTIAGSPSTSPRCARCWSSPSCSGWPTRWRMVGGRQMPGLHDKADGSFVTEADGTDRRQPADRPGVHRRRRQPDPAVLPVPPVRGRRRLRPDGHRGQQPRPGEHRGHPRRPGDPDDDGASRACSPRSAPAARRSASWRASTARRPVLHRRRCRRGARGLLPRRPDRHRSPGRSASTRPARRRRSSPPTRACRSSAPSPARTTRQAACSPRSAATRRPARPCRPTRSPPAASGLDPHISPAYAELQAPRVARERGVDVADGPATLIDAAHHRPGARASWASRRVNVLELNLALDRDPVG